MGDELNREIMKVAVDRGRCLEMLDAQRADLDNSLERVASLLRRAMNVKSDELDNVQLLELARADNRFMRGYSQRCSAFVAALNELCDQHDATLVELDLLDEEASP